MSIAFLQVLINFIAVSRIKRSLEKLMIWKMAVTLQPFIPQRGSYCKCDGYLHKGGGIYQVPLSVKFPHSYTERMTEGMCHSLGLFQKLKLLVYLIPIFRIST